MHTNRQICSCGICRSASLDLLWDLPKLPLTEQYGTYDAIQKLHWDQQLLICTQCGHVQLGIQLAPAFLYTPAEYSFRTSQSKTARMGTEIFYQFFRKLSQGHSYRSLVDIGGNDLFLAKMANIPQSCVVDPICSAQDGQLVEGVKVFGRFIEEIDFQKEGFQPDLVFCRHVLEHVAHPRELLSQLFQQCSPDALYLFEIPCFENLVEAHRFDAIFHQHYHYFDLATFQRLIAEVGGEYVDHLYNRQGSCGGALLIAFRQGSRQPQVRMDIRTRQELFKREIVSYQKQMELLADRLVGFHQQIYGYGASLMLATLGYHLGTDFSELICVLDDDPQKDQIGYRNIPVTVRFSTKIPIEPHSNFLITSLENSRAIFKRITELTPRRILVPLIN